MKTLMELAGTYTAKSPYHKNKKLPFNIESDGYVTTIEYKGWSAFLIQGYYTAEKLNDMVNKKIIVPGRAKFLKVLFNS